MKKRTTLIIITMVAAFTLLAVTAFANEPVNQGYEAFKNLMKDSHSEEMMFDEENVTVQGRIKITDNNDVLMEASGEMKVDKASESGNGSVLLEAGELTKALDIYMMDDMMYLFDDANKEYYQAEQGNEEFDSNEYDRKGMHNKDFNKDGLDGAGEELLDFVMGDLKDDFSVSNHEDGSKTVSFELTKEEMPTVLNLLVSAAEKDMKYNQDDEIDEDCSQLEQYPLFNDLKAFKVDMPEIVENLSLDYINFEVTVDENNIPVTMSFSLRVSGDDESGKSHDVAVDGQFEITNIGTTSVDQPVLSDKEIITIDKELCDGDGFEGGMGRRR